MGKFLDGIILNGVKYEAVDVPIGCECACDGCALQELCDGLNFSPCEMFEGVVHFRIRR